jgi:putative peptidoglycan lipid II flippase
VIANILLNLVLVRVMGYAGLALGTSVAAIVNAAIQFLLLRRALDGLQGRQITVTFLKATVASLAMAAAAWYVERWLRAAIPGADTWIQAVRVCLAIGVALGVLAVSATLLRLREFEESRDMVMKRLSRLKP